ncbi:class I SAM-dependent methyltransferase [Nocardia higoensis]|uniref:class I SAM-dependent methyltransferase n=1 Tax=Nocardia higoensis TaxID=228599 RepID=UPI0002DEC396|nr:class I SAM-dependent methyltransferase [Nocardia higoensis]
MTFALTPQRRSELAALLEDAELLRAQYPRMAEYLDTAPMLAGTGDPEADAAFDLRFVHYMAGGDSDSGNPYWDIVGPSVGSDGTRRVVNGGASRGSARLAFVQTILQSTYAYAIPSPETLRWITDFTAGRTILELGAGRGYWAQQLAKAGGVVRAFDVEPPHRASNPSFPATAGQADVWHEVEDLDAFDAAVTADSVLFLCWPPGWENPMSSTALEKFGNGGGRHLVYVGEPRGGKTGDDSFFDSLDSSWSLTATDPEFVSWWNLNDAAQVWQRHS